MTRKRTSERSWSAADRVRDDPPAMSDASMDAQTDRAEPIAPPESATRGSLLARNVALNIAGTALPGIAALVAVPVLVRALGDVRSSVLMLAWTTLGYFSLFDLGMGRAVAHAVADRIGGKREHEIGAIIWTSLLLLTPVALAGTIALILGARPLAEVLGVPADLMGEAVLSFRILALAIPFAAVAGALRGALEARQYFGIVNALRVPHGLTTFVGPLLALPFSRSLVPAVAILTIGRAVLCVVHLVVTWRMIPQFRERPFHLDRSIARAIAVFGGWTQVTYIVSPIMATLDRFAVGAVLGIELVTYYAAPNELVTKMWLFPIAVLPVFFSALATTATRDPARTATLFDRLLRLTVAVTFLPAFMLTLLAPDVLRIWLGPAYQAQSTLVMQVLAIAVFVNCVGQGAYTLIQGLGRPEITGKYHVMELGVFFILLTLLLPRFGILGAAMAWSIRTIGDTILLLARCPSLLRESRPSVARVSIWLVGTTAALVLAVLVSRTPLRIAVGVIAIPVWAATVWRGLLTPAERGLRLSALTGALRPERA
jgi:O-antigen/teichoic acid export membrane protein